MVRSRQYPAHIDASDPMALVEALMERLEPPNGSSGSGFDVLGVYRD